MREDMHRPLSLREPEKTSRWGQQFRMTVKISSGSNSIRQRHTGGDGSGMSGERGIAHCVSKRNIGAAHN